jgi:hypothetical protein
VVFIKVIINYLDAAALQRFALHFLNHFLSTVNILQFYN